MKVYIWQSVSNLTSSWHSGGGIAVIEKDLEAARKRIPPGCDAQTCAPDFEWELVGEVDPVYFAFPDSGCC